MIDPENYTRRYYEALRGIVRALPDGAIPPFLSETSFVVGYSDNEGKLAIQLLSRGKAPTIQLNGNVIEPKSKTEPGNLLLRGTRIERLLFPHDGDGTTPSMTIDQRNIVLDGVAFSSKQYNDKYWSDATFYRMCAGDIPFTVGKSGALLALNILWGAELSGVRDEKVIEYLKLFGSDAVMPASAEKVQDEAFRDFGHAAAKLGKKLDDWKFTDFINGLSGPVERNVLLLGSYRDSEEFEQLRSTLAELGYNGFLLKDSPDLPIQSNLEKLLSAIICSCFIIVLDKHASGHLAELGNMLQFRFRPVIILRDTSTPTTAFLEDQILVDENFRVVIEPNPTGSNLLPSIRWAREMLAQKKEDYNAINSWRGQQPARANEQDGA